MSRQLQDAMVALAEQRCRFLRPVFVGDVVTSRFEVVAIDRKRGNTALVRFNVCLLNKAGDAVLEGEHAYFLRWRERAADAGHTDVA
jgi:3-hydroxybutyryl-CoA dehydratase